MEEETHRHIKRLHIYILILTVSIFVLLWFFLSQQKSRVSQETPAPTSEESQILKENKGFLSLQTKDNQRTYPVGAPVVLQVLADSEEEDIVGFDVLLALENQDLQASDVSSVTSSLAGFRVVSKVQLGHLSVTAVQEPQNSTRQIFKNTVIAEIVITPRVTGTLKLSILPQADPESTKMVTAQTKVLFPEVKDLTISIQ